MDRRAAVAVVACVLLGACAAPHGSATLDHEPDLAAISATFVPAGMRDTIVHEISRLRRGCTEIEATVATELPDTHFSFDDVQCHWTAAASANSAPRLVVGIVDGGDYRFRETITLLDDERRVHGVGDEALYDPQMRVVFTVRADRLWYVQLVATSARGADAQRITTAVARALMHASATR